MFLFQNQLKKGITLTLLFYILAFSTFITILTTTINLYVDYATEIKLIEQRIQNIQKSSLQSLSQSLWYMDSKYSETLLNGILQLPDIQYLEITSKVYQHNISAGMIQEEKILTYTFPLLHKANDQEYDMGSIHIVVNLNNVYQRLFNRILVILGTQTLKTFLVSGFIFIIVQWLITRHLIQISTFLKKLNINNLDQLLVLPASVDKENELSHVVNAVNTMKADLHQKIKSLKESEERFRAIYEHAPVLIDAFDKNGRCLLWNNECQRTFGWTIEEINEHGDALSLFYPDPTVREEVIRTVTTDPDGRFCEWHPLTKDGRTLTTMWANFSLPDGLTFNLGYDITERKAAEKEHKKLQDKLLQAQKMEAVGTLAGGIAHDFNNILSAILGFTELARDNTSADKQLKEDLDEICKASLRAKKLVQQILSYSRKTESQMVQLHAPTIIEETIKLLRNTLPTSIAFEVNIDKTVSAVMADPTHLHQIIMNLATNAAHSMEDDGGTLTIQLSEFSLPESFFNQHKEIAKGNYLRLKIKDTGCGIPPETMDSIFDPYFTTKKIGDGTGLGLAVTHGLISKMGGAIEAESILGEGSIFTVYLPVSEMEPDPEGVKDVSESLRGGNERILLVDDEPSILKLTSRILSAQGYSVITESEGQKAYARFAANPYDFDLVISDVNMPKLTGDKLAQKILEIRPDMHIILASGYSKKIFKESVLDIGGKDLINKPISKENLLLKVRQVLDQQHD